MTQMSPSPTDAQRDPPRLANSDPNADPEVKLILRCRQRLAHIVLKHETHLHVMTWLHGLFDSEHHFAEPVLAADNNPVHREGCKLLFAALVHLADSVQARPSGQHFNPRSAYLALDQLFMSLFCLILTRGACCSKDFPYRETYWPAHSFDHWMQHSPLAEAVRIREPDLRREVDPQLPANHHTTPPRHNLSPRKQHHRLKSLLCTVAKWFLRGAYTKAYLSPTHPRFALSFVPVQCLAPARGSTQDSNHAEDKEWEFDEEWVQDEELKTRRVRESRADELDTRDIVFLHKLLMQLHCDKHRLCMWTNPDDLQARYTCALIEATAVNSNIAHAIELVQRLLEDWERTLPFWSGALGGAGLSQASRWTDLEFSLEPCPDEMHRFVGSLLVAVAAVLGPQSTIPLAITSADLDSTLVHTTEMPLPQFLRHYFTFGFPCDTHGDVVTAMAVPALLQRLLVLAVLRLPRRAPSDSDSAAFSCVLQAFQQDMQTTIVRNDDALFDLVCCVKPQQQPLHHPKPQRPAIASACWTRVFMLPQLRHKIAAFADFSGVLKAIQRYVEPTEALLRLPDSLALPAWRVAELCLCNLHPRLDRLDDRWDPTFVVTNSVARLKTSHTLALTRRDFNHPIKAFAGRRCRRLTQLFWMLSFVLQIRSSIGNAHMQRWTDKLHVGFVEDLVKLASGRNHLGEVVDPARHADCIALADHLVVILVRLAREASLQRRAALQVLTERCGWQAALALRSNEPTLALHMHNVTADVRAFADFLAAEAEEDH